MSRKMQRKNKKFLDDEKAPITKYMKNKIKKLEKAKESKNEVSILYKC